MKTLEEKLKQLNMYTITLVSYPMQGNINRILGLNYREGYDGNVWMCYGQTIEECLDKVIYNLESDNMLGKRKSRKMFNPLNTATFAEEDINTKVVIENGKIIFNKGTPLESSIG